MNSLVKRRQAIIDGPDMKKTRRAYCNNAGTPVPVARKAGKRPNVSAGDKTRMALRPSGVTLTTVRILRDGTRIMDTKVW